MMAEPPDLEESARREQRVVDTYGEYADADYEVPEAIAETAHDLAVDSSEVIRALLAKGHVRLEDLASRCRISGLGAFHLDRDILVDAEVRAIVGPMAIPVLAGATCRRCGTTHKVRVDPMRYAVSTPKQRAEMSVPIECFEEAGGCKRTATKFDVADLVTVNYHRLRVADYVPPTEASTEFSDVELDLHLFRPADDTLDSVPSRALFHATVQRDPQSLALALTSEFHRPLDLRPVAFVPTPEDRALFLAIGTATDLRGRPRALDEIAPRIVARDLAKEAVLLVLHSVPVIPNVSGEEIAGVLSCLLYGDSATTKTMLSDDVCIGLGLGQNVDAGSASRAGLTFVHKEVAGVEYLEFGAFPRNHLRLLALNGVEAWPPELQMQLRDVLANHRVVVNMKLKGARPAYVRTVMTANPQRPMVNYPWPAAAIREIAPFEGQGRGPDVRRIQLWIPHAEGDTTPETIAQRIRGERPWPVEDFRRKVTWSWTRQPEHIRYSDEARAHVRAEWPRLYREYGCASLPIVNLGYEETLCAISVAEATLAFSTSDGTDVQVTRDHVVRAVDFLTRMFDALRLKEYRQLSEEEVRLSGGEALDVCMEIGDRCLQELGIIAASGEARTAEELAAKVGVGKETVWKDDFRKLEAHGLIAAIRGLGATVTTRGLKLVAFVEAISRQGGGSI